MPPKPAAESADFDVSDLQPESLYVGRIDMMGARAAMTRSIKVSGNFIGKLHVALLNAPRQAIKALVPTVDGAYIVTADRSDLTSFMKNTFRTLAGEFVRETDRYKKFVVRGGIAYGPVVLGSSLGSSESAVLARAGNASYRDTILIGFPVVQAYEVEESAPPFGIRVDVSARAFAPESGTPLRSAYYRWLDSSSDQDDLFQKLKKSLASYFLFMQHHEHELGYPEKDRLRHEALYREYFWQRGDE